MRESFRKVRKVLSFGADTAGLNDYYSQWAETYESDIRNENWVPHEVVCDLVKLVATSYGGGDPIILDAGCGTGLVGKGLHDRGFTTVDGIDLNATMVSVADRLHVYRTLRSGINLNDPDQAEPAGHYDIVVSSGTFTQAHAAPIALHSLKRFVRPGGIIIVSTRISYLRETEFEQFVQGEVASQVLSLLFCLPDARYIDEENANYWVLKRPA